MFTLLKPTERAINQVFGANPHYYMQFGLPGHEGVDFACPWDAANGGDPIHACAEGVVSEAGNFGTYGLRVILKHTIVDDKGTSWSVQTIYAHLSRLWVRKGQSVFAGQAIGLSGNSGKSGGPHLHLTVKVEGMVTGGYPAGIVDPEPFFVKAESRE